MQRESERKNKADGITPIKATNEPKKEKSLDDSKGEVKGREKRKKGHKTNKRKTKLTGSRVSNTRGDPESRCNLSSGSVAKPHPRADGRCNDIASYFVVQSTSYNTSPLGTGCRKYFKPTASPILLQASKVCVK